jgi:catechol 2,3-dioxygenase-like lactoylglutathione lyase family enzyme
MKLAGVCLITKSVPALAAFYARVLGVQAVGDDTHAELRTEGAGLAIFSVAGMEGMAPGSTRGAGVGGVTLMFEVKDVDAEYARLQALGVTFIKPPQTHPWGSRSFWFRDPDGNIVDLYATLARA